MGDTLGILDSIGSWARAIVALQVSGALPLRTVLVPSERHAHALRRELLRAGHPEVLAGTRFVGAVTLAIEVLHGADVVFEVGEDALRPARLLGLLEEPPLEYFDLDLVRRGGGWNEAIAHAIGTLEAAGLTPERLPETTSQWCDLATLWRRLDAAAGTRWTAARILREAADRLGHGAVFAGGPVLAAVTGHEPVVHAAFVRALPGVVVVPFAASPTRDRHGQRLHALFGLQPLAAGAHDRDTVRPATELEVLQRYLFTSPETLADPHRPLSAGRDGTVELEEHAGVEGEVEAAADWVAREILERKTPLERIAVLVPVHDPLAGLVADRLARLPWGSGALPVHVAGGLPITAATGGARVRSVLHALSSWLSADAVATVLPSLRAPLDERQHLTHGEAMELAWSLGTVGGGGAHPGGALEWTERASTREQELATSLAVATAERSDGDRATWHVERALASLRAARPALEALVALARLLVEDAPLADLAPALASFVRDWVLDPADGVPVTPRLAEAFEETGATALGAQARGPRALEVLDSVAASLRVPVGRFGQPAVFVGSVARAAGLDFDAVRIIGLCEGTIPPAIREDPVLPDAMRAQAHPQPVVPRSLDRVLQQLQAFDRVVRDTQRRLVLSAPRVNLERTEREPSSLFIEVGAALGRPDVVSGKRQSVIPDLPSLRRDAFGPAREASSAFRTASPLGAGAWLRRAASDGRIPPPWSDDERFDLSVIEALGTPHPLSLSDGVLGPDAPLPVLPGITPERPISASALATLLRCPRSFLYERVLHWSEPAGAPSLREVDQPFYGNLFHEVMEGFYRAHGTAFVARERTLGHWQRVAADEAGRGFAGFLSAYPLVGDGLRARELDRLRHDVRRVLEYDWGLPGKRTFVDVERAFGEEEPVALSAGGRTIYLRGYIDRLDVEGDHTLVRDLKTGNAHPRTGDEAGIAGDLDLQLAVYGIVVKELAGAWGLPAKVQAAYVYPRHRGDPERAFRDDFDALEAAGREWLALAARLLHERVFPPTTVAGDCTWCPLRPFCGTVTPRRSAEVLAGTAGTLGAFRDFKAEGDEE